MKSRDKDKRKTVESVLESRLSERVKGLSAYSVPHHECSVKLDGNESPFTLPPEVAERVASETNRLELNRYPDAEAHDLRMLLSATEISELALERWVIPRAHRTPEYRDWDSHNLIDLFGNQTRMLRNQVKSQSRFKDAVGGT